MSARDDGTGGAAALVRSLIALERRQRLEGRPVQLTWLNHYSVGPAFERAAAALRSVDVCGIDGQLLKRILRHPSRTSADLVVPLLLQEDTAIESVLAVGGEGDRGQELGRALSGMAGRPLRVHSIDGFDGLPRGPQLHRLVSELGPDLVLVGVGAGLQEEVLQEVAGGMQGGYAMTCGGFLDQALMPGYYPPWAYPLRLNWLIRLAREPRRLWRRYTVDAVRAALTRRRWRRALADVPGIAAHAEMTARG